MNITPFLTAKNFFRFTGPPENWLTAIKYMTWGLEEKYKNRWNEIQTGDIFFIHSTGMGSSLFSNARSGIVGIGVVGSYFSIKNSLLWIQEIKERTNKWPLLVPFSEIYLFSDLPDKQEWESPNLDNKGKTYALINRLLTNFIPLSQVKGFPQMGSFSTVSIEVAKQILYDKRLLYSYIGQEDDTDIQSSKPTKLREVKKASETLRHSTTLEIFDSVKARIINRGKKTYTKDNELLSRAETVHATILQQLIDLFIQKGYRTLSNKYVDLFAHNENRSFLFDVKSIENNNFKSQARKGLIQLFEYNYFEVRKYISDNNFDFKDKFKILALSKKPSDIEYIGFINDLKTGVAMVENNSLKPIGTDFGFSRL